MKQTKVSLIAVVFGAFFWLLPSVGETATKSVDCSNPKKTLQGAINKLKPGDTLLVSGTCNENVVINESTERITVDGQGAATINGPDNTRATIEISGRNITIKRFASITGGQDAIRVNRGGTALIGGTDAADGNTLEGAEKDGIAINSGGFARIGRNTIRNNTRDGIIVNENSVARIGIISFNDTVASPNTIQGNGRNGITVTRSSQANIVENTIKENTENGVGVFGASQAGISKNTIDDNGQDGIQVSDNSGVNLGRDVGTGILDAPNDTTAGKENTDFGIRCRVGGYANGRLGTLTGADAKSFGASCTDSLDTADTY